MAHSMWNLPRPGIKPESPALAADSQPLDPQGSPRTCMFMRARPYSYTREGQMLMEELSGGCNPRPRGAGNPQKLKGPEADSRPGPRGWGVSCPLLGVGPAILTLDFHPAGLGENIFLCFKSSHLWYFVTALGNEYIWYIAENR